MPAPARLDMDVAREPARALSRRSFVHGLGAGAILLGGVRPVGAGQLVGCVGDAAGVAYAGGALHLFHADGRPTGRVVVSAADGSFAFPGLAAREYQLHFHGGAAATLDDASLHVLRVAIHPGETVRRELRVVRGTFTPRPVEVACADGCYRALPDGDAADVTVALGSVVCWRNMDRVPHTVTGGPWGDSGEIASGAAWYWIATQPGRFAYHCRRRGASMRATVHVTA